MIQKLRNSWKQGLAIFAIFQGFAPTASAVSLSHYLTATLMGGQYFFENEESELSGNASVLYATAIKIDEKWTVIPTVLASWRGTKSVQDLVGGGTLFQQTQDHAASAKAIYKANNVWQFKGSAGYRIQLLKETRKEDWGKGLFDYEKPSFNFEMERFFSEETALRAGYSFYWIDFRNYNSLESQQRNLGRENAGSKTLNTRNNSPYLSFNSIFPYFGNKAKYDVNYYYTFRNFTDQRIVLPTGSISTKLRSDRSQIATARVTLPYALTGSLKLLHDVSLGVNFLNSDQSNYDAAKTRFNPNFYDYKEYTVGTNKNFVWGTRPWIFTAGFTYVRRNYVDRPTQNSNGDYGTDKIHLNEYYMNLGVTYPVNKNFRVQALGNFGWSRSNMKYEQTYRYNYETFTYLLGVVYEY